MFRGDEPAGQYLGMIISATAGLWIHDIKRLRAKVDKFEHEEWEIKTIWGVGYRFEEKEHAQ